MKKFLLALAFVFCAASVSAQGWGLGARINAGVQLQGEYTFSTENYLDARLGINFPDGLDLDLTLIYQWHIGQWDWTPKAGTWFFDAGLGAQAALLMHDDGGLYAGIMYRHPDRVDRMDLLDKFVGVVAQQCDKQTADKYLKELGEGKYTSLMRIIDGRYYYVGEEYIKQMYMQAKQQETQDQPEM
jgi:hypothetical protein